LMDSLFGTLQKPEHVFKEDWFVQPSVLFSSRSVYIYTRIKVDWCLMCYLFY
jgi:hypothetical protein